MMGLVVELMLAALDRDSTRVPVTVLLDITVNDAPATLETAALIVRSAGLYWSVKLPDVTPRPLVRAIGMPKPGRLLATLIGASEIDTPGEVEPRSWLVDWARALWKVTKTLAPVLVSLVTITTELGVLLALALRPIWLARPPRLLGVKLSAVWMLLASVVAVVLKVIVAVAVVGLAAGLV